MFSLVFCSISAAILCGLYYGDTSQQVLYKDNSNHIALVTVSIIICMIFTFKLVYEYFFDPEAWKLFMGFYCFFVVVLIVYQSFVTISIPAGNALPFKEPSHSMLNTAIAFCLMQVILILIWSLFVSQRIPHVNRVSDNPDIEESHEEPVH